MRWKEWDLNLKIRLLGEGMINILFWMFFPFMAIYFAESFGKRNRRRAVDCIPGDRGIGQRNRGLLRRPVRSQADDVDRVSGGWDCFCLFCFGQLSLVPFPDADLHLFQCPRHFQFSVLACQPRDGGGSGGTETPE